MASKKKKKKLAKKVTKKKAPKKGDPRTCSVCGTLGHNKRSHAPGGKLN